MVIKDSILRDLGRLFIWYPFRWIVQLLPLSVVFKTGQMMGWLESLYSKNRLAVMALNICRSLKKEKIEALNIARKNLELHYVHLLEFFKFPAFNKANIDRCIEFRGIDHLDASLKKGKGVILIHLHFGTMQFPLIALGYKDYPMNQLGQREPENKSLSWVHRKVALRNRLKIESSIPANFINIGMTGSLRPAFRCLQENKILLIPGDGRGGLNPMGKKDVLIDFLGQKTSFPRGPVTLARKTGAKMLPLFCYHTQDGRHCVDIRPPISMEFSNDRDKDLTHNTQLYANALAKGVMEHPAYWMFWQEFSPGLMICEKK